MEIETVIRESQAEALTTPLGFQTETGKQQFSRQLRFFTSKEDALRRRQTAILLVKSQLTEKTIPRLDALFERAAALEPHLDLFFKKSDVEKDSYTQLTFSAWAWAEIFNTFPFVLLLLSYFKLYAVPFLALLTPLFMAIMPYMILTYWYNLPISIGQYKDLMLGMMGIQSENFWTPKNLMQTAITLASIGQSIYQPIQNALHLQTIEKDLRKRGVCVEELGMILQELSTVIPLKNPLADLVERSSDPHRSFAESWDLPYRIQYALQLLGDAEVTYRIAVSPFRTVMFTKVGGFHFANARDPLLPDSIPFQVSFDLGTKHHAILTGPNRGGKSSFLRATLLNIVLAQTFGFCYSDVSLLKPVNWIATGLRLEDRPGKSSMFEREVEFAVDIVKRAKRYPNEVGLVLFDELFHSTNPPDGTRTAKLFLDRVWAQPNLISIISTHVFDLAKNAPQEVERLCVPALETEEGGLEFTYTLTKGICEVSSVDLILKEKGLL